MTGGVRNYELALQPYGMPAIVEDFSVQIYATTPAGQVITGGLPAGDHRIRLVMAGLASGLVSVSLIWRRVALAGVSQSGHSFALDPAAKHGTILDVMHDASDALYTHRGKTRRGAVFILTVGRPRILGFDAGVISKLREEARIAGAKHRELLGAVHSAWRAHGGRPGD